MKVIFLDFDGVLNNSHFLQRPGVDQLSQFDPRSIKALNLLLEWQPDAQIVVSSTWRMGRTVEQLEKLLVDNGVECEGRVIGKTPMSISKTEGGLFKAQTRGNEINSWLERYAGQTAHDLKMEEIDSFVILDDDKDMEPLMANLVQTNFDSGLTVEHAEKAELLLTVLTEKT